MLKRISTTYLILAAIVFLGFTLRIILINKISLYGDELTLVYDTYSLLKTGLDQTGQFLPITFKMGAGRPGGYIYASLPFVAIFGPSPLGIRALSILSGLVNIILIYLLGRKLFSKRVGIIAGFIYSISIWDLSLSIGGFEAHFALFLALLGTVSFIYGVRKPLLYILSAICFALAIHTYPTYKLSLIFIIPLLIWFNGNLRAYLEKKVIGCISIALLILVLAIILAVSQTLYAGSESRFSNINIFNLTDLREQVIQKINEERVLDNLPNGLNDIFHNKPVEYSKLITQSYSQNFSWDFLFFHGDKNPRHNMSNFGELYFVEIILLIVGLYLGWLNFRKITIFLIAWILIAPIPAALLFEQHALRSSFMLPPLVLISSLGLNYVFALKKGKVIPLMLITVLFLVQFVFFIDKFYFLSPNLYSRFWSAPAKKASELIIEKSNQFDFVIVSDQIDNIEYAYPVYAQIDPQIIIEQNKQRSRLGSYAFKKIGNIYIGYIPDSEIEKFINSLNGSVLFIGSVSQKAALPGYYSLIGNDQKEEFLVKEKI